MPTVEDWHAKVVFPRSKQKANETKLMHFKIFSLEYLETVCTTSSAYDFGTLYQIKNLVNRRNVKADPSKNVNASEDFFLMVVHTHIIAAAMHELSTDSVDENPTAMDSQMNYGYMKTLTK